MEGKNLSNSNLKNFDNFYADLAQAAYRGRPVLFPYEKLRKDEKGALDSGDSLQFDFSQDAQSYNEITKNWKSPLEVKTFLMMVKSTCSRILICKILIKSHRYQFLMRMG